MNENTENMVASSPPPFMTQSSAKVEDAGSKVEKDLAKEASAQDRDDFERRSSTLAKATSRIDELTGYLGKIDAAVIGVLPEFVASHSMGSVLDTFAALEDAVEGLEKGFKELKGRIDYAREVSLPARMDDEESKTFTSADTGHRISRTTRLFASILTDKTEAAFQWLRDNGLGPLIKETVNSSSLSGAAKEIAANGHEMPEDIFRVHTKDGVSITRKKAKA